MDQYLQKLQDLIVEYSPKVITALILLIVGLFAIKFFVSTTRKVMTKREVDITLQKFLLNLLNWGLKILLFILVVSKLGIETTSFAAIIAAAGLAVGLALQGSLSNFAGGVLIMIFRPFKIGDFIEAQGETGVVKEISIFTTNLIGLSNKEIIIPNGSLSNGNIVNYSSTGTRRVDFTFGVSYDADIKQTKEVLHSVLKSNEKILEEPAPTIAVVELADSSVNFAVRPWVNTADYWDVYFDIMEKTKIALDKAGIEIPYPHQVEIRK
ncbi:MAG: mechanosensitive ion channel protein [Flavobacteriaceae bacterium]|nr:mechanosensitive ion channel protein [Flavobacteriaceae bacterium]|tara:strand:+ start:88001 stop:88801 length:801 start_codon:yes stop_codon:yes gene_type:complete